MKAYPIFLRISLILTILCTIRSVAFAQKDTTAAVHVGMIYPVSSNGQRAADYTNDFSLHVIAGVSKNERVLSIAGAANVIKQNASGVQVAGAVNLTGAVQKGAQVAGFANIIGGEASGLQIAGFSNIIKANASGAQVAGFMNLTGSANALQLAGFSNIDKGKGSAVQVTGFLNKADEVHSQVAGFANIARKVKGIQFAGFMNIADSSDYPIGIFNFIKNGEKSISISTDETLTGIAAFRSGGRVLYGIAGIGYDLENTGRSLYAAEAGLGAHIPLANSFRINLEAISHTLTDFKGGNYNKNALRVLPALRFGDRFEIFAGPTVNYVSHDREDAFGFVKKFIWKNDTSKDFQGFYVGFNAGLQIIL